MNDDTKRYILSILGLGLLLSACAQATGPADYLNDMYNVTSSSQETYNTYQDYLQY